MSEITTVGVDLAKEVIVVCAGDKAGRPVFSRQFTFHGFAQWAVTLSHATFGMEACSSAHHWARWLTEHGHVAKLIAAEHVAPFRMSKGAKNDRNDAQAILAAVIQPAMRFVSVKSVEAQAMLAVHTMRRGWNAERTALINRTRGLLAEFGIWLGRSASRLERALPELTDSETVPPRVRLLLRQARAQLAVLDQQIDDCDRHIQDMQCTVTRRSAYRPLPASAPVGPSAMKPWLTIRQRNSGVDRSSTSPTDENRIRTSRAVYILARAHQSDASNKAV